MPKCKMMQHGFVYQNYTTITTFSIFYIQNSVPAYILAKDRNIYNENLVLRGVKNPPTKIRVQRANCYNTELM